MRNIKNRFISTLAVIAIMLSLVVPVSAAPSTNYTLTGNQADDIVRVATAQKGLTKSQLGYVYDWCAYFVCWVGRTAGADFPQSDLGYPVDIARWFVNNNKGTFYCFRDGNYNDLISRGITKPSNIVRTSRDSFSPKKGDLICYLWFYDADKYNWSHIGIVAADYAGNGLVSTVEGNVGNRVGTFNQRYNSEVIGIIRPNYSNNSSSNSTSNNPNATLALNNSSYTLKPGEQTSINFTFTGTIDTIDYAISDTAICDYAGGEWNQNQHKGNLIFKAKSPGTASITLFLRDKNKKVLDTKTASVTVQSTTTLSTDVSNITLDLAGKSSQTVTLTLGGYTENCELQTSWSTSNIATNRWDNYQNGTTIHAIVTASGVGKTTLTYSVVDKNTKQNLATKSIAVTVTAPNYVVQYNANGGINAPALQTKTYQKPLTLSSAQPTRAGYTFNGWSTSPSGSVQYRPGDQYSADKNLTLYAVWSINTVTIDANVSTVTLDLAEKSSQAITLTLGGPVENNCQLKTTTGNSDIAVNNWDNYQSGTVVHAIITGKAPGTTTITYSLVDNNTQKTLAAKTITVTVKTQSYTVQYNANGGTSAPASQTKTYQKVLTLSNTQPTRMGYTFSGWSTSPNGSVQYHPGDQYSTDKDLTLYAVWSLNSVTIDSDISNITLDLPGKISQTITLTLRGPVENNCQLKTSTSNPDVAVNNWDNYQSGTIVHAIITAKSAGTTTITYSLVDINTQQTLASKRITVTVRANTEVVTFQGHSYQVFDDSMTWEEAKAACAAKGGHLATITSQAEQNFVANLLSSHSKFFYWLGASDTRQEGTWEWVTGETWSYKNWLQGQPDNYSDLNGRTENYLAMERTSKRWNDLQNAGDSSGNSRLQNGGYICEWDN